MADWLQQKCIGHLLKDLSSMRASKTRGAVRFAHDVTALLRAALALRDQKPHLSLKTFRARARALEQRLDRLIDPKRKLTDPDNRRFAKRLRKQRPHLLRFLHADGLDPTNNQAERMLRPAVTLAPRLRAAQVPVSPARPMAVIGPSAAQWLTPFWQAFS